MSMECPRKQCTCPKGTKFLKRKRKCMGKMPRLPLKTMKRASAKNIRACKANATCKGKFNAARVKLVARTKKRYKGKMVKLGKAHKEALQGQDGEVG